MKLLSRVRLFINTILQMEEWLILELRQGKIQDEFGVPCSARMFKSDFFLKDRACQKIQESTWKLPVAKDGLV